MRICFTRFSNFIGDSRTLREAATLMGMGHELVALGVAFGDEPVNPGRRRSADCG